MCYNIYVSKKYKRLHSTTIRKAGVTLFAMNTITQKMRFRQALVLYAEKYGVTKAAIRYSVSLNMSTAGRDDMMEHCNPWQIDPTGHTAIPASILRRRLSSS